MTNSELTNPRNEDDIARSSVTSSHFTGLRGLVPSKVSSVQSQPKPPLPADSSTAVVQEQDPSMLRTIFASGMSIGANGERLYQIASQLVVVFHQNQRKVPEAISKLLAATIQLATGNLIGTAFQVSGQLFNTKGKLINKKVTSDIPEDMEDLRKLLIAESIIQGSSESEINLSDEEMWSIRAKTLLRMLELYPKLLSLTPRLESLDNKGVGRFGAACHSFSGLVGLWFNKQADFFNSADLMAFALLNMKKLNEELDSLGLEGNPGKK